MARFGQWAMVILMLSCDALAADPPAPPAVDAARQRVTFTESSPFAGLEEYCRRTRQSPAAYKREGTAHEYALAEESFEVVVPPAHGPDNHHGLLVWISPGNADLPRDWFAVLARHKLIWICPHDAGNRRHFLARIGLALDAVHNAKKAYTLDPSRIYVAGFSGGGRVSSILILTYPDVFRGAIPMMGCNFYRPLPAGEGKMFQAGAARPIEPFFRQVKQLPIALVTGERDANQPQSKANYEAFGKDRFAHVTYHEVPGIGHTMPPPVWLERALGDLDAVATAPKATKGPTSRPATRRGALIGETGPVSPSRRSGDGLG